MESGKEIKVPEGIKKVIASMGSENEHIIAASATDMNIACEYVPGYVVLTKEALYILTADADKDAIHSFKGYIGKKDNERDSLREWHCTRTPIDEIRKLEAEPKVSIGTLIAEYTDGECYTLAVFSNLYRKSIHMITREFEHLKPIDSDEGGKENKTPGGHEFNHAPGGGPGRGHGPGHGHGPKDDEDMYCPKCGRMYPNPDRKVCPHCSDKHGIFIRMFGFFKPYTPIIAALLFAYVFIAVFNIIYPYLNGTILYDRVLKRDSKLLISFGIENGDFVKALFLIILAMFVSKLLSQLLTMLQGVATASITTSVVRDVKKKIFTSMSDLSISFFRNRQTGSLMTRVLGDAERVTGFFIDEFPYIFIHSFTLIASLIMMFKINWQMSAVACVIMPISVLYGAKIRPKFWTAYGHRHRAERTVNNRVNDNLTGARVVKAFGQERLEESRFRHSNYMLKEAEMTITRLSVRTSLVFNFTHSLTSFVIWLLGAAFIINRGTMELGVLITFVGYMNQLERPMNFLSEVFKGYADSMNAAQRMFEIIDAVPDIREAENPVRPEKLEGHIQINNLTFGYEVNRPVLKNINLDIPAGSMLGIVGRSGAGKTTLVNLISRLYDPDEGEILIDGVNIKEIGFKELRRNVAMVSQETYIFMGTIEENIAYAKPGASKAEIIRAAKLASAHDFILKMPDGYNTVVGSSGRGLSGGERQRISIARAILANPKILILDEATASVDTETERAIQASINYLIKDRTTISIAHRLSTLRDADFLCVIDNGEITERGTHSELKELKGTYYKLMELQTKALALRE